MGLPTQLDTLCKDDPKTPSSTQLCRKDPIIGELKQFISLTIYVWDSISGKSKSCTLPVAALTC